MCTAWVDNRFSVEHGRVTAVGGCGIGHNPILIVVDLVVHSIVGLLLLRAQEVANESDSLAGEDEGSSDGSLAGGDQGEAGLIATVGLLILAGVGGEDVVAALEALVVWEQDNVLGVGVQLVGGLLDDREALIDLGQCLIAEVVRLLDVGLNVLVGAVEIGHDGSGKGLVSRVAELDGLRAVRVRLERLDAIMDNVVTVQVLCSISFGSEDGRLAQQGTRQVPCAKGFSATGLRNWFP